MRPLLLATIALSSSSTGLFQVPSLSNGNFTRGKDSFLNLSHITSEAKRHSVTRDQSGTFTISSNPTDRNFEVRTIRKKIINDQHPLNIDNRTGRTSRSFDETEEALDKKLKEIFGI